MAARLSIVLVEDNDDLRDLTADALRAEGHRVTALACAEELEDRARGVAADLFLIDLNLPGEDGFSLSRRIRKAQPLVGIVIVSARSDLQGKVDGYECGADWYLPKPVPIEELLAAISSFARRSHATRQAVSRHRGTAPGATRSAGARRGGTTQWFRGNGVDSICASTLGHSGKLATAGAVGFRLQRSEKGQS